MRAPCRETHTKSHTFSRWAPSSADGCKMGPILASETTTFRCCSFRRSLSPGQCDVSPGSVRVPKLVHAPSARVEWPPPPPPARAEQQVVVGLYGYNHNTTTKITSYAFIMRMANITGLATRDRGTCTNEINVSMAGLLGWMCWCFV